MGSYTVIGAWINDRAVPTGVIEGVHQVAGGDDEEFPQGLWAAHVEAETVELAQMLARSEMQANDVDDDFGGVLDFDGTNWVLRCDKHGEVGRDDGTEEGHDRLVELWAGHDEGHHGGDGLVETGMLIAR